MKPVARRDLQARRSKPTRRQQGYLLIEVLVYFGLLVVVLAVAYQAMFRCVDSSVVLRRDAEDISRTLHIGERWRADVRAASRSVRVEVVAGRPRLYLIGATNQVDYRFDGKAVQRRLNSGPWVRVLEKVKACAFERDQRSHVCAWRWELELQPESKASVKASRIRPLFTFLAVPSASSLP